MISIIIPVYNSSESLEILFYEIQKVFGFLKNDFEVIFVEDHSKDQSWETICALKEHHPEKIKAVKLSKNFGQHNAIMCGLHFASGDMIITMDDDLQTHPQEIPKLINEYERTRTQLVYGLYKTKKHRVAANAGSFLFQKIFKIVFKNKKNITSFRLFTKDLGDRIKLHPNNFVFVDELLHAHTKDIAYTYVEHKERVYGDSNYTIAKLIHLGSNLFLNFALQNNKPRFSIEKELL